MGGKKTTRLFAPSYTKNGHFAKTGSGQTWGKQHSKGDAFTCVGDPGERNLAEVNQLSSFFCDKNDKMMRI